MTLLEDSKNASRLIRVSICGFEKKKEMVMPSDINQVKRYISILLSAAKWVETIVPGEADDKIIDAASALANQPWFADFALYILNLFEGGKVPSMGELNFALTQFVPNQSNATEV